MTVQDRLRATTEAITDTMREVRPLTLPPEQPVQVLRPREPRRLPGWLVPLAAAAAVVAVAATLVAVRDVRPAEPSSPAPVANAGAGAGGSVPEYYVQLGAYKNGAAGHLDALVADDRTGAKVATVTAPAGLVFDGVSGAADDRTFVLDAVSATTDFLSQPPPPGRHTWFLLRIAPGTSRPATLTTLPITAVLDSDQILGLALSPDASALAVQYGANVSVRSAGRVQLRTFSLRTGQPLRTWNGPQVHSTQTAITIPPSDGGGLTWTPDGKTLAFTWLGPTWHSYLRMISVASKSGSLLAESRAIFSNPGNQDHCTAMLLTPSGRAMLCGTVGNAASGCRAQEPRFKAYSAVTGRLDRVLYTYRGSCQGAMITPLQALAEGSMIGVLQVTGYAVGGTASTEWSVGVFSPGKFTPLRVMAYLGEGANPGEVAF